MEPLLRQLLTDINSEHVNADACESDIPAIRQEQLFLQCYNGRWWLPLALLRAFRQWSVFDLLYILVIPEELVPHVRQEKLVDVIQLKRYKF